MLHFHSVPTEIVTLATGDYSVRDASGRDLRDVVVVERKSGVEELAMCCGKERERFERELVRLGQIRWSYLVVEATLAELARGSKFSGLTPKQIVSPVFAWSLKHGVHPIFAGDRTHAAAAVRTILSHAVRYIQ